MSVISYTLNIDEFTEKVEEILKKEFSLQTEGFTGVPFIKSFMVDETIEINLPSTGILRSVEVLTTSALGGSVEVAVGDVILKEKIFSGRVLFKDLGLLVVTPQDSITITLEEVPEAMVTFSILLSR